MTLFGRREATRERFYCNRRLPFTMKVCRWCPAGRPTGTLFGNAFLERFFDEWGVVMVWWWEGCFRGFLDTLSSISTSISSKEAPRWVSAVMPLPGAFQRAFQRVFLPVVTRCRGRPGPRRPQPTVASRPKGVLLVLGDDFYDGDCNRRLPITRKMCRWCPARLAGRPSQTLHG